jgi:hypothetical protein
LAFLAAVVLCAGPALGDTPEWDDQFGRNATGAPGLDRVLDVVMYNGTPHAVGKEIWDQFRRTIYEWDGATWIPHPLPDGYQSMRNLCVMGGEIYMGANCVGGNCVQVGKWNGSSFSIVGLADGSVHDVVTDGTNLYVSGNFTEIGGVPARRVAMWNGSAWSEVGGGADDYVGHLFVDGTDLYISGWFDEVGGLPNSGIAKWDGASWDSLGTWPANFGAADPIIKFNGDIYTGTHQDSIGRWDGSTWELFPTPGWLTAAAVYDGYMYFGMQRTGYWMLKWDGTGEPSEYYDFEGYIYTMRPANDRLYVGGLFEMVGGWEISGVAEWFGESFLVNGCTDDVEDIVVGPDGLYAGGQFLHAGATDANYIGRWDGTRWSPLGDGMSGAVNAVYSDGSDVYAGGNFVTADSVATNRIARWDGSQWHALGTGLNSFVYEVAGSGGDVYAGGLFTSAGGAPANRIARWDGSNWHALGTGTNATVRSILIDGADVYAGGDFNTAGGVTVKKVARWDGSQWHALGSGLSGGAFDMAMRDGKLYVGGNFATAGGVTVNRLGVWDGAAWSDVGGGFGGSVYSLAFVGGDLYAGGQFTKSTTSGTAKNIAVWDGVEWSRLDVGTDGRVTTLCVASDGLYAGGQFMNAGGGLSEHFGRWTVEVPTGVAAARLLRGFVLEPNAPNPFNPSTTIRYTLERPEVVTLAVYDVTGRLVRTLERAERRVAGDHSVVWDGRDNRGRAVASGVYFYRLNAGRSSESRKMTLLK